MKLGMLKIEDIVVEERARKDMGDIDELAFSIKKSGLIQPLAVREENGKYFLLAGGRRLEAIKRTGASEVGARIYNSNLSELDIKTIELSENLYRKNLTFVEDCMLKREIHLLQQQIHGQKGSGGRPDVTGETTGWSQEDTAEMLGCSKATVSQDIRLADAMLAFPELFEDSSMTKSDATKILKRVGEEVLRDELAKRVAEQRVSTSKQKLMDSFIVGDFFDGVKKIPDGSIDFVEVDPPYAIALKEKKRDYAYGDSYNEVDVNYYLGFLEKTLRECFRVMGTHSWLVLWFAPEPWFETIYQLIENTGFTTHRMCGLWTKPSGQTNQPNYNLANSYEMFFYARKGQPTLAKLGRINQFDYKPIPRQLKVHPTERPIELMYEILTTFAFEGSRLLVPFLGSGNTLIAGHLAKLRGIGYELSETYKRDYVLKVDQLGTDSE